MIKRLFIISLISFFLCSSIWANEERNVILKKGDPNSQTIELDYAIITVRLIDNGSYQRIVLSMENTLTSQALLLFKHAHDENALKSHKPKIEFEKTYPGSKGSRSVHGCRNLSRAFISLTPQEKMDIFGEDLSGKSVAKIELPIYVAKYDANKLVKKGAENIPYKILNEEILIINIEIKGWSEDDPAYLSTKAAVEEYVRSANNATFCKNKKHTPSLSQQMKPYKEKRDSLMNVINSTIKSNSDWQSKDLPYIKYSELLDQLNQVNLNDHTYDCKNHRSKPAPNPNNNSNSVPTPKCSYCSLSAQQIYHQLDDIYQQKRSGKLAKDAAIKRAQGLYNCYQNHSNRKKDSGYTEKISRFYGRIINK
ncbi:MAG: hypothetical protein K2G23_07230 [Muribaculaceae bacterium]|nr:hypothetical protein [Muribaculaceae bacterium]